MQSFDHYQNEEIHTTAIPEAVSQHKANERPDSDASGWSPVVVLKINKNSKILKKRRLLLILCVYFTKKVALTAENIS